MALTTLWSILGRVSFGLIERNAMPPMTKDWTLNDGSTVRVNIEKRSGKFLPPYHPTSSPTEALKEGGFTIVPEFLKSSIKPNKTGGKTRGGGGVRHKQDGIASRKSVHFNKCLKIRYFDQEEFSLLHEELNKILSTSLPF